MRDDGCIKYFLASQNIRIVLAFDCTMEQSVQIRSSLTFINKIFYKKNTKIIDIG